MAVTPPVSAYSPYELWYWNSLPLNQPYWNIATFGGSRFGIPTNRGQDYQVPYRAGQLFRQKYPDSRTVTLTMWTDSQGSASQPYPASDSRLAFNDNWAQLRAAFITRGVTGSEQGLLVRNWWITQAGVPTMVQSGTMAEIAGSMDPTMNGRTSAAFSVDLLLSDPYFYGTQRSQAISTAGGSITAYGEGIVGEGFFSLVNAFNVTITAPCQVVNNTAGVSFAHNGQGVASWPVTVDPLRCAATDNVGNNVVGGLSHTGSRMWMALVPGANSISVSAGVATFTWNDCYA